MLIEKHLIILANSRKLNGRCVAGKEIYGGQIGEWIRPVGINGHGELSLRQIQCQGGSDPNLLDIVKIELIRRTPQKYQTENCLVNARVSWEMISRFPPERIAELLDEHNQMWLNGHSSGLGRNDRIPHEIAEAKETSSLRLIRPENLSLLITSWDGRKKIRVEFILGGVNYSLGCTDPVVERKLRSLDDGKYHLTGDNHSLCVSLGSPFEGYVYKLVAGIIGFKGVSG